jgi:hypothetical protein
MLVSSASSASRNCVAALAALLLALPLRFSRAIRCAKERNLRSGTSRRAQLLVADKK